MTTTAPAPVILPEHPGYDDARRAWNLAVDQRPAGVVEARSADDVLAAVAHARAHGLQVAAQSTGHLAAALPDLDRALLVRTCIGGVEVDPPARRARVGAGAIWQDVTEAVAPHGLAALSGSAPDVGVVGYTLAGGVSWLGRSHGLAANHVHAIEVVTADGVLRRCDAERDADLFWALRGGAGSFGVVTAIEIGLLELGEVVAGMTIWPAAQAREVLEAWAAWTRTAPESVTTAFRLLRLPPLPEIPEPLRDTPIVVVDGCVTGMDGTAAGELLAPVRSAGTPLMDTWAPMPPTGLAGIHMDPPQPVPGIGDGILLEDLDPAAIDAFLAVADPETVCPLLLAELRQLGGALGRAPEGAGARGALEGAFGLFAVGSPMVPGDGEAIHGRVTELLGAMAPHGTGTVLASFSESGGSAERAFPPEVYERLRDVRTAHDPGELFVGSHRIAPR
jgi:FAD/FMN-containing dehydrogenase